MRPFSLLGERDFASHNEEILIPTSPRSPSWGWSPTALEEWLASRLVMISLLLCCTRVNLSLIYLGPPTMLTFVKIRIKYVVDSPALILGSPGTASVCRGRRVRRSSSVEAHTGAASTLPSAGQVLRPPSDLGLSLSSNCDQTLHFSTD